MSYVNLANTQLVGKCTYNHKTGKASYESFSRYYSNASNKLFK